MSQPTPDKPVDPLWDACIAKVESFRDLAPDWDGLGSEPPSAAAIDRAVEVLGLLREGEFPPPEFVLANHDGGVSIEWLNSFRDGIVAFEIQPDGSSKWTCISAKRA